MTLVRFLPPRGIARTLAVQSLVYATGNGVFLTGSAVFFVHVVGLRPTQVGVGLSISGALTLLLSVPMGTLTDRIGARRTWFAFSLAEAALFCGYPLVRGFWMFVLVVGALAVASAGNNSGRSVYTIEAVEPEQQVRVLAFSRSALNLGFTAGSLLAGAALTVNTTAAYDAMVLANAAGLLASAMVVVRLPDPHGGRPASPPGRRFAALRDRPFLAVTALCGVLLSYATIFSVLIPLWTITQTRAPRPVLTVLFVINTVLVIVLQVPAARGGDTLPGSARALRRSGLVAALACPLLWLSGATPAVASVVLLAVAIVLISVAELWQSTGSWGVSTLLPPAGRRGEYIGAFRLGNAAQSMAGPALLTWLAIGTGGWGWTVIAAILAAAAVVSGPVVRWAESTPRLAGPVPQPAPA